VPETHPKTAPPDTSPLAERDPRCIGVLQTAQRLFARRPDWVTFFRRILGPEGIVSKLFPTESELQQFEQSQTYFEVLRLLTQLRESQPFSGQQEEPTRVITVRLPESVHEALRVEAFRHCTSMNKLCISKLLQYIEEGLVPGKRYRLRRRRAAAHPVPSGGGKATEKKEE
jgi:hypothetical protein